MAKEQEFFFFIADISGYTSYMLTNQEACDHAKLSINEIIKSLIKISELPIEISKLEGDAIFLYMQPTISNSPWLSKKLFQFFAAFDKKLKELKESTVCQCGGCKNIEALNLKIIVHYGLASLEKVYQFKELSGVAVIVTHRLLKNHVQKKRYVLLTETACQHMQLPENITFSKESESYEDIGEISIYVCDPPYLSKELEERYDTLPYKIKRFIFQHLNYFFLKIGIKKLGAFHNLPPKNQ